MLGLAGGGRSCRQFRLGWNVDVDVDVDVAMEGEGEWVSVVVAMAVEMRLDTTVLRVVVVAGVWLCCWEEEEEGLMTLLAWVDNSLASSQSSSRDAYSLG